MVDFALQTKISHQYQGKENLWLTIYACLTTFWRYVRSLVCKLYSLLLTYTDYMNYLVKGPGHCMILTEFTVSTVITILARILIRRESICIGYLSTLWVAGFFGAALTDIITRVEISRETHWDIDKYSWTWRCNYRWKASVRKWKCDFENLKNGKNDSDLKGFHLFLHREISHTDVFNFLVRGLRNIQLLRW